jgi:hypothetical protein
MLWPRVAVDCEPHVSTPEKLAVQMCTTMPGLFFARHGGSH